MKRVTGQQRIAKQCYKKDYMQGIATYGYLVVILRILFEGSVSGDSRPRSKWFAHPLTEFYVTWPCSNGSKVDLGLRSHNRGSFGS